MKFFIPGIDDEVNAEKMYGAICKFNTEQMGATLSPRRIYSVTGRHNGKDFTWHRWQTL